MLLICMNCHKDLGADAEKGYLFCNNCRKTLSPQQITEKIREVRKINAEAHASKKKKASKKERTGNRKRKDSNKVNAKTIKSIIKSFHGPRPDGDEPTSSIHAFHGGLPGLGKHH